MFKVIIEADYALFSRPECKVERASYPVPTPSALEGVLKSVYWKPSIRYVIDQIVVFHPIVYTCVVRNEVKEKASEKTIKKQMEGKNVDPTIYAEGTHQKSSLILKNVRYGVAFHFELTGIRSEAEENGDGKHASIIKRRLGKGQYFRAPCMGCREFTVRRIALTEDFNLSEVDASLAGEQDLGVMLYGLQFHDDERLKKEWKSDYFSDKADPHFYHPYMIDGVIDVAKYREAAK